VGKIVSVMTIRYAPLSAMEQAGREEATVDALPMSVIDYPEVT
jgi:hypothetical protein